MIDGAHWKDEYLIFSFEQLILSIGRIEVKRVCECALVRGPVSFSLKTIRDIQTDGGLREASERHEQIVSFVECELLEFADGNLPADDEDDGAKTFYW